MLDLQVGSRVKCKSDYLDRKMGVDGSGLIDCSLISQCSTRNLADCFLPRRPVGPCVNRVRVIEYPLSIPASAHPQKFDLSLLE